MDGGRDRQARSRSLAEGDERKRREMREQLRRGYREMAHLNLTLAEEGPMFEGGRPATRRTPRREQPPRHRQAGMS